MSGFTPTQISNLFPAAVERVYDVGQIIVYDGDRPPHVLFVESGVYKFHDVDTEGNEKILHIGGAQSFFPLFYAFEDKQQVDGFYTTLAKSKFLLIPIEEFRHRLKTDAHFCYQLLTWYAGEMDNIVLRLKSLEKSTARHKLVQALAYLCEEHSVVRPMPSNWYRITFNITQQTLAELTGLTRETVNMTLKDIETLKVVRSPKKLTLEINKTNLYALLKKEA